MSREGALDRLHADSLTSLPEQRIRVVLLAKGCPRALERACAPAEAGGARRPHPAVVAPTLGPDLRAAGDQLGQIGTASTTEASAMRTSPCA